MELTVNNQRGNGDCPICHGTKDGFSFDNRKGVYICSTCGYELKAEQQSGNSVIGVEQDERVFPKNCPVCHADKSMFEIIGKESYQCTVCGYVSGKQVKRICI